MLTTTQRQPAHDINLEKRRILVLRAWEAASTERELQGVLEAITQVLVPVVPYDGVAPSTLEFRIKRLGIDKFRFRAK